MEDKSLKETIREELDKLARLTWKERLVYVWDYYKPLMAAILGLLLAISVGMSIYRNLRTETLLNVYLVNCNSMAADQETLAAAFTEYIGGIDRDQQILFDTSVLLDEEDTSQYALSGPMKIMAVGAAGEIDVMLMDPEHFEEYQEQGYFGDLRSVLTEEQQRTLSGLFLYGEDAEGNEIVYGLDLSEAPLIREYGLYPAGVYGGIYAGTTNTELCGEFFAWLFS